MSTLEKGRPGDAQDFQTVLPGMMACFFDAACSPSQALAKLATDVTIRAVHIDRVEKPMDLSVFLDLLVIFHERTDWKLKYAGPPKPADVVKAILQLLYNLTAELTYSVIGCKACALLLMTKAQEGSAESGAQRHLSNGCDFVTRHKRINQLKKQLVKTP